MGLLVKGSFKDPVLVKTNNVVIGCWCSPPKGTPHTPHPAAQAGGREPPCRCRR